MVDGMSEAILMSNLGRSVIISATRHRARETGDDDRADLVIAGRDASSLKYEVRPRAGVMLLLGKGMQSMDRACEGCERYVVRDVSVM